MAELIYSLYTLTHIALLFWGIRLWRDDRKIVLLLLLLPISGLVYDNGVIALGRLIGEGPLLLTLNQGRFLLHALITPMLAAAAVALAAQAGVAWTQKRAAHALFGLLTLGLIAFSLVTFSRFVYAPEWFGSTLRYVDVAVPGPPVPSIVTIIIIMAIGVFVWREGHWPWQFVGALVMFVGSAIPASVVGPVVGSGAEVILLASLLATERAFQDRGQTTATGRTA